MSVTVQVEGLDRLARAFKDLPAQMDAGVKVVGERNTAFALLWEWGSAQLSPGPKTLWSVNPIGEEVILTRTAPYGYIRVNRQRYLEIIQDEYAKINWASIEPANLEAATVAMMDKASIRCAQLISQTAPIDTGELRENIVPARVGDSAIRGTENDYGPTQFEIGEDWG